MTRIDLRRRAGLALAAALAVTLAGCVSIGNGDLPPQTYLQLHDAGAPPARRAAPLVDALLIQAQPTDALIDSPAIVYARRPHEYAAYQLASWTERPQRQLPRLLQQRLQARGVAGAVGQPGDGLRADWQLTLTVEALYHDLADDSGRIAFTLGLVDRRSRVRIALQRFAAAAPAARADSAAAAAAMSQALGQALDAAVPWLEAQLQRATAAR